MTDLHVARWRQRYEVERGDTTSAERLSRVGRHDVIGLLDSGVHRIEAPTGEWCIRSLHSRTEIAADATDAAIAAAVAASILDAIAAATGAAVDSDDVCHYTSVRSARLDCIRRLAAGDPRRWWAWHQLGLVDEREPQTPHECLEHVVALIAQAGAGVTTELALLARHGLLLAVANRIGPGWHRLVAAIAASRTSSGGPSLAASIPLLAVPESGDGVRTMRAGDPRVVRLSRASAEIQRRSQIAGALDAAREHLDPIARRGLAMCAIAEAEPDLFRRLDPDELAFLVAALTGNVTDAAPAPTAQRSPIAQPPRTARKPVPSDADARAVRSPEVGWYEDRPPVTAGAEPHRARPTPLVDDDRVEPMVRPTEAGRDSDEVAQTVPEAAYDLRSGAAGLLFLLNLVDDDWLDRLWELDSNDRGLRWWLCAVATAVVAELGASIEDPVIPVFGGLDPGGEGFVDGPSAGSLEAHDASLVAAELGCRLADRLDLAGIDDLSLEQVVLRPGSIIFEGGWIEAELPLSDADVRIRQAGLDLDPGWLPWLGCVVRFRYV